MTGVPCFRTQLLRELPVSAINAAWRSHAASCADCKNTLEVNTLLASMGRSCLEPPWSREDRAQARRRLMNAAARRVTVAPHRRWWARAAALALLSAASAAAAMGGRAILHNLRGLHRAPGGAFTTSSRARPAGPPARPDRTEGGTSPLLSRTSSQMASAAAGQRLAPTGEMSRPRSGGPDVRHAPTRDQGGSGEAPAPLATKTQPAPTSRAPRVSGGGDRAGPFVEHRRTQAADVRSSVSVAERAFADGWQALRSGDQRRAVDRFAMAGAAEPGGQLGEDARYWQAVVLGRLGRKIEARRVLGQFLERYPRSPRAGEIRVMLGWNTLEGGDREAAGRLFRSSIDDPSARVRQSAQAGVAAVQSR